jgi:hypothetical protein
VYNRYRIQYVPLFQLIRIPSPETEVRRVASREFILCFLKALKKLHRVFSGLCGSPALHAYVLPCDFRLKHQTSRSLAYHRGLLQQSMTMFYKVGYLLQSGFRPRQWGSDEIEIGVILVPVVIPHKRSLCPQEFQVDLYGGPDLWETCKLGSTLIGLNAIAI